MDEQQQQTYPWSGLQFDPGTAFLTIGLLKYKLDTQSDHSSQASSSSTVDIFKYLDTQEEDFLPITIPLTHSHFHPPSYPISAPPSSSSSSSPSPSIFTSPPVIPQYYF